VKSAVESLNRLLMVIYQNALDLADLLFFHLVLCNHDSMEIVSHHLKTTVIFHLAIKQQPFSFHFRVH
jgi:hypothetical protein